MFENTLFMIRNGIFGTDYALKLGFLVFSLIICLYDWKKNGRKDYFWVFGIGALIWFLVEFSIQMAGVRVTEAFMFGRELPTFWAALLRGAAEGGFIILLGLFFADRLTKKWMLLFIGALVLTILGTLNQGMPERIGAVSRRDLFATNGLFYLAIMLIFDIVWLWKSQPSTRKRALWAFFFMVVFTGTWTMAEFFANTRWIEFGNNLASPFLQFVGLSYDVIMEIAVPYLPFLGLAYLLGLIREKPDEKSIS